MNELHIQQLHKSPLPSYVLKYARCLNNYFMVKLNNLFDFYLLCTVYTMKKLKKDNKTSFCVIYLQLGGKDDDLILDTVYKK